MKQFDDETGAAMVIAVGFLGVLGVLSGAFFAGVHRHREACRADEARVVAFHAAEGGVHYAIAKLANDAAYAGEEHLALGGGRFRVNVGTGNAIRIVSTGWGSQQPNERWRARIEAVVDIRGDAPVITQWRSLPAQEE